MRLTRVFFLILIAGLVTTGCRKPDGGLGLGLQPEGELLDLRTDTLPFSLEMVRVDSLRTDERSRLLLGTTIDPISGLVSAYFSTELRLSQTAVDFGDSPVCDSVEFVLRFNGPAYGLNADQYLVVEQLADTLNIDSAYYAQDVPPTLPGNLVDPVSQPVQMHPSQSVYVGNDTLSPQVRMLLQPSFGQSLLDAAFTTGSPYDGVIDLDHRMPGSATCGSITTTPRTRRRTTSSSTQMLRGWVTSGTAGPRSSKPSMTACPRRMPNASPSWGPVDLTCAST